MDFMDENSPYFSLNTHNPKLFITIGIIIVAYILLFFYINSGHFTSEAPITTNNVVNTATSSISWVTIIIIAVMVFLLYKYAKPIFQTDVVAQLHDLLSNNPKIDIETTTHFDEEEGGGGKGFQKKQVFNIPANKYTYNESKDICSAFNAKLATYDQIEKAYNDGGEWCNFGWSEGQYIYMPTQKSTFDELQKVKGHENNCGRVGINGGKIDNPNARFGVNCYGVKPPINEEEREMMASMTLYPKTEKDILLEKKVQYWKKHLQDITVSPFNHESWSNV
jgi:hypothetical protein